MKRSLDDDVGNERVSLQRALHLHDEETVLQIAKQGIPFDTSIRGTPLILHAARRGWTEVVDALWISDPEGVPPAPLVELLGKSLVVAIECGHIALADYIMAAYEIPLTEFGHSQIARIELLDREAQHTTLDFLFNRVIKEIDWLEGGFSLVWPVTLPYVKGLGKHPLLCFNMYVISVMNIDPERRNVDTAFAESLWKDVLDVGDPETYTDYLVELRRVARSLARNNQVDLLRIVLAETPRNMRPFGTQTRGLRGYLESIPLMSYTTSPDCLTLLLDEGLSVYDRNMYGHTPLMYAVMEDDLPAVRIIMNHLRGMEEARLSLGGEGSRNIITEQVEELVDGEGHTTDDHLDMAQPAIRRFVRGLVKRFSGMPTGA